MLLDIFCCRDLLEGDGIGKSEPHVQRVIIIMQMVQHKLPIVHSFYKTLCKECMKS